MELRYTYDMKTIAVLVAILLVLWIALVPFVARAKPQGDSVGASTAVIVPECDKLKGDNAKQCAPAEKVEKQKVSKEERQKIRELKREIKRLEKSIRDLMKEYVHSN